MQLPLLSTDELVRTGTSYRLDATNAGSHSGFAHNLEEADLRRITNVRPPAELHREAGNLHYAHDVPVLLAEEPHRARLTSLLIRHLVRGDGCRAPDLAIHDRLDLLEPFAFHWTVMSKVK